MDAIFNGFCANKLSLNATKTQYMDSDTASHLKHLIYLRLKQLRANSLI